MVVVQRKQFTRSKQYQVKSFFSPSICLRPPSSLRGFLAVFMLHFFHLCSWQRRVIIHTATRDQGKHKLHLGKQMKNAVVTLTSSFIIQANVKL